MQKESLMDVMKEYLKDTGYTASEAKKVIDNFELGLRGAKGSNGDAPKKKVKVRHGTTCMGIITSDENQTVMEL